MRTLRDKAYIERRLSIASMLEKCLHSGTGAEGRWSAIGTHKRWAAGYGNRDRESHTVDGVLLKFHGLQFVFWPPYVQWVKLTIFSDRGTLCLYETLWFYVFIPFKFPFLFLIARTIFGNS